MRKRLGILAAVAVAGLTFVAGADGACRVPDGARVEARNSHAVVYTTSSNSPRGTRTGLRGCVEDVGREVNIDGTSNDDPAVYEHAGYKRLGPIALNGTEVANAAVEDSGWGTGSAYVQMLDLRQPRHRFDAGGVVAYGVPSVPRLVLTADGAVAYTIGWPGRDHSRREVRARDRNGLRTVDSGHGVGLQSLERHGSTIEWTHGGARRTAHLARTGRVGRCRLEPGADIRAMDEGTLVYTATKSDRYDRNEYAYACDRRTGDRRVFASADGWTAFEDTFRVNGRYVAYSREEYDHYGGEYVNVEVHDLATGRDRPSVGLGGRAGDQTGPDSKVVRLVLSGDGDLALTLLTYDYPVAGFGEAARERHVVAAFDRYGYVQLDDDRHLELDSLRLSHGRVSWKRAGDRYSERLWPSRHRVPCSLPEAATVLVRTTTSVAYRYPIGTGRHAPTRTAACFLRSGRVSALGEGRRHESRVVGVDLAGPFVAFGLERLNDQGHAEHAVVRSVDLRTGLVKWESLAGQAGAEGRTLSVPGVALAPDGGFAYIVVGHGAPGATGRVRVRWAGGQATVYEGDDIYAPDPDFAFDGRVVRWWAGGKPHERRLR